MSDPARVWPTDAVDTLLRMWTQERRSAGEIARHLTDANARTFTRNGVIGKINRLGLTGRGGQRVDPVRDVSAPALPPQPVHPPVAPDATGVPLDRVRAPEPPIVERVPARRSAAERRPASVAEGLPASHGVPLADLGTRQCRYAVSAFHARSHRFCGLPTDEGESWCATHAAVVFEPRQPRRGQLWADRTGENANGATRRFR